MPEVSSLLTLAELRRCHSTSTSGVVSPAVDYTRTPSGLGPCMHEPDVARKTLSFLDLALPHGHPTKSGSRGSTNSSTIALARTWAHDQSSIILNSRRLSSHDTSQHCAPCAPPAKVSIVVQVVPHTDTPLTPLTGAPDLPCPWDDSTAFERAAAHKSTRSSMAHHAYHCDRSRDGAPASGSKARSPKSPVGRRSPGQTSEVSVSFEGLPRPENAASAARRHPDDPPPSASSTPSEATASSDSSTRFPPPPPPPKEHSPS